MTEPTETSKTNKTWYRRGPVRALVPLSVVAVIAGNAALAPTLASAAPSLPPISAQQLLTRIADAHVDAFSGTVSVTANLGLPQLPDLIGSANPLSLITGSHLLQVSVNGPTQQRIALMDQLSEYDVIHNGKQIWTYDSETNAVEEGTLGDGKAAKAASGSAASGSAQLTSAEKAKLAAAKSAAQQQALALQDLTPQAAAQQLLAAISPTTQVSVGSPRTVAGRSAYLLVLAPKQQGSLIGQVAISVDAATGVPLGVTLYPVDSATPFFDVSFTQVDLTAPPSSRFDFTPPKDAAVSPLGADESGSANAPAGTTPQSLDPQVLGTGWLTAVELHGVSLGELSRALSSTGSAISSDGGSAATSPEDDGGSQQLISGGVNGYLSTLLGSGKTVSGAFGTGKVYTTSVLTVLITDDGRIFLGPVTASVLEADAAQQGTK
jgi:outer membrane lipoprotein-sorting protein